jgi:tetratricopeptide (TPR) repeat protein
VQNVADIFFFSFAFANPVSLIQTNTNTIITSITSRHADKPGNGKTTLAVATIQTVEMRERFSDGIAWIQLGRTPLTEKDVRRLYEELFRQLVSKDRGDDYDEDAEGGISKSADDENTMSRSSSTASLDKLEKAVREKQEHAIRLAESRQRFQGGDLEAIKEDLASIVTKRKILLCLDDVWRVDDAKWFIFDTKNGPAPARQVGQPREDPNPYRILVTTRTPALFGNGVVQEIFVRIFSEHEAVKLLLSSAGRRPYGGKSSAVFNQARIIVKGCGNSPMAVRLAGGMLRRSNRNWNTNSPTWNMLIQQCRLNLEEASRLRSFVNSVVRVVDLSFASIANLELRVALRRCFVTFALAFKENDWVHVGRGIPQPVLLKIFDTVINAEGNGQKLPYSADFLLEALETMNLMQRARHGVSSHYHDYAEEDRKSNGDDDEEEKIPERSSLVQNPSYVMHASLQAIAEDVATRPNFGLLPSVDDFTSFGGELSKEKKYHESRAGIWAAPLRFLTKQLSPGGPTSGMAENGVHELVVSCLLGTKGSLTGSSVVGSFHKSKIATATTKGGDKLDLYMCTFLPTHLMRAEAFVAAGELMTDPQFIRRRVGALGVTEATRRHMSDLLELRRDVVRPASSGKLSAPNSPKRPIGSSIGVEKSDSSPNGNVAMSSSIERVASTDSGIDIAVAENVDTSVIMREGARAIVNEVHHVVSIARGSTESLGMAICLSTVGEGLLKGKQPRDAMLRLEEAVIIYRGLLGQNHIDVARSLHSVARALVKLGENRVALHKFSEAAQIYEACNATMLFDSIANAQNLATLLVDLGEWEKANARFEDVIAKKKAIYGEGSVSVAKTINSYAILLAKHSRMNEALKNYVAAKETYEAVPQSLLKDPEFDIKCKYDMTLINLNIASIRSKKGDLKGAIESYEDGVRGLREYAAGQEKLHITPGFDDTGKNSHLKHLVAALGRIGSLKLKIGDTKGALAAYQTLLDEVDSESPNASQVEKAKAHIKCATIHRQEEGKESHIKAIAHLREALDMYTNLFGPDHKDTLAIASSLRQWLAE